MLKYGIMMNLPDGKLPGFYAQIIKAIAHQITLFDRDKELLIVQTEEEVTSVIKILEHYKLPSETLELLLLPDDATVSPYLDDYGFTSRTDRTYLYKHLVSSFHFKKESNEKHQAFLQLQEHLIAQYNELQKNFFVIDKQLDDLAHRIAEAYECEIAIINP